MPNFSAIQFKMVLENGNLHIRQVIILEITCYRSELIHIRI
jgi:hypothetical protein